MIPTSQDRNTKIPPSQVDLIRYWKKRAEAAKQRELELLAVIESVKGVLRDYGMYEVADLLLAEPSQALREHEAKVLEDLAGDLADAGYADSLILKIMDVAEERRKN